MRVNSAVLAAASIGSSFGFLITPEISNAVNEAKNSLNDIVLGASRVQSVDVKCYKCALVGQNAEDVENTIHLEFSTQSGVLQINNATVFPIEMVNAKFPRIKAHQNRVDTGEATDDVPIDFALSGRIPDPQHRHHRQHRKHRNNLETVDDEPQLITVDFTVIGMEGKLVKAQTAHADLVLQQGWYTLARLRAAHFEPTAEGQDDLAVCANSQNVQLCRMRLMAANRLREMLGAARGRTNSIKEWMRTHGPGNKPRPCHGMRPAVSQGAEHGHHKFEHGSHAHGQHHGHHHRHHRVLHYAFFILKALIIPALLGFAIGFTVSAVGMLVGRLIVYVWTRFYRGGERANVREEVIIIEEGEKQGLMSDDEELPVYEYHDEAPVYEEVEK